MKLTILTDEQPFPATHGGRVDVWRRLQAFASEGVKIQLIFWCSAIDIPTQAALDEINSVCESVLAFPISRSFYARVNALRRLPTQSLYLNTRALSAKKRRFLETEVSRFSPEAIWLDGLFAGKSAIDLANRFNRPLFNRSRNIEFKYRQIQYERALGMSARITAWMVKSHLESFELSLLNRAEMNWDISLDDLQYWKNRGVKNIKWLPPFADQALINEMRKPQAEPEFDFVYLGNLYTPNNIEGVSWFLQKVFPAIRARKPAARFLLAGINPHPKIQHLSKTEGVKLISDAPRVSEVYSKGNVLINPILAGSGVNVKSVEMLFAGKPIVTSPQGAAGLPAEIQSYFTIAHTPEDFAEFCLSALENSSGQFIKRDLSALTFQAIKPVLNEIQTIIKNFN